MTKIPFSEDELKPAGEMRGFRGISVPVYATPVSPRENYRAAYEGRPYYQPTYYDAAIFSPNIVPDNIARGWVMEKNMVDKEKFGGADMFGIVWEYVPLVGGSMVRPGKPFMTDANEWYDKIVWPDIDEWDWEGSAKANNETYLNNDKLNLIWILNGAWFERLVSFMEFENAAMALIDEDQQQAVKDFFEKSTELLCHFVDNCVKYYKNIDGFTVHDDWGSQANPFFSEETAMEMIVPYMKKLTDHIHSKGLIADLHSCGHIESRINAIIAAGWDSWTPMPMNDTAKLYEEYGDKIMISVIYPLNEDCGEAEQRKAAAEYVEKFCKPGKRSASGLYSSEVNYPFFREEQYKLSRIKYSK